MPSGVPVGVRSHELDCRRTTSAPWRSGYAAACKAVYTGSIPVGASPATVAGVVRSAKSLLVVAVLVIAAVVLVPTLIPSLNPFEEETVDRSQPVLLRSISSLSQYRAATANLQVVVDVEQDAAILPDFIKGEKTLLVAAGTVDASVDFRGVKGRNLRVNEDRTAVTITIPRARLSDARVDLNRTRVFDRDRGLLDRIGDALGDGGADQERQLLQLAQRKLAEAARANPDLQRTAERNTKAMLEGMMRGLGFTRVTIRFAPVPRT
jgi:hypothetical protein